MYVHHQPTCTKGDNMKAERERYRVAEGCSKVVESVGQARCPTSLSVPLGGNVGMGRSDGPPPCSTSSKYIDSIVEI